MAASKMRFSLPSPPDTGRRCPWCPGEPLKCNLTNQHAQRLTSFRVVAGLTPPTRARGVSLQPTLKPSALGESGRASRVARAS